MEKNNKTSISRRSFLKTAAAAGAALTVQPAINRIKAANVALNGENVSSVKKDGMPHRTLGTGRAASKSPPSASASWA